jgi:hypothetical protein
MKQTKEVFPQQAMPWYPAAPAAEKEHPVLPDTISGAKYYVA